MQNTDDVLPARSSRRRSGVLILAASALIGLVLGLGGMAVAAEQPTAPPESSTSEPCDKPGGTGDTDAAAPTGAASPDAAV